MTKAVKGKTPLEAWLGYKPSIKHFRVFGSICYFHIQEQKCNKMDAKAKKGIFIDYDSQSKGHRILNLEDEKIVISQDVTFNEDASWNLKIKKEEKKQINIPIIRTNSTKIETEIHSPHSPLNSPRTLSTIKNSSDTPNAMGPRGKKSITELYARFSEIDETED